MPTLNYTDAYLQDFVTDDYENRAIEHVESLGTFPTSWKNKLVIARVYYIVCVESQADPDDLFSAKLKTYSKEFDILLTQARIAAQDASTDDIIRGPIFNIPLERA